MSKTISVPTADLVTEPSAAAERDAAEHGRRQHDHFEPDADVSADRAEPGGEEERPDRG